MMNNRIVTFSTELIEKVIGNDFTLREISLALYLYNHYNKDDIFQKEDIFENNDYYRTITEITGYSYSSLHRAYKTIIKRKLILEIPEEDKKDQRKHRHYYMLNPLYFRDK